MAMDVADGVQAARLVQNPTQLKFKPASVLVDFRRCAGGVYKGYRAKRYILRQDGVEIQCVAQKDMRVHVQKTSLNFSMPRCQNHS